MFYCMPKKCYDHFQHPPCFDGLIKYCTTNSYQFSCAVPLISPVCPFKNALSFESKISSSYYRYLGECVWL